MEIGAEVGSVVFAKQYFDPFQLLTVAVWDRDFDLDRTLLVADGPIEGFRERCADLPRREKFEGEGDAVGRVSLVVRLGGVEYKLSERLTGALTIS